ncbi:MAG: menaquinol-cytochrome c reductase cytochrome b subunit [Acidimicrobiales bacterium]
MTEIPEHLRKRAEAARQKAAEKAATEGAGAPEEAPSADAPAEGGGDAGGGKIPAHLLERSKAAKARKAGATAEAEATGGGGAVAPAAAAAVATAAPPPSATGPAGHTQRLLTVVKAGSIQDVKAAPQDKVHVWPHLLAAEFVAALFIKGFTLVFSIFVNAPLLELANVNQTPNPSKAPWYFLGLQELLTMFHPMVAGVTIPGMGIFLLILAPYMDRNPSNKPEDRKFAISVFTLFLMFWTVLVIIGSFFRGPGFNFVAPWDAGLFFEL